MAGLDSSKKRSSPSTKRVSRFSEVLGAAQENTQMSGYPDTQPSEQQATPEPKFAKKDIQKPGYPDTQLSEQPTPTEENTQKSGYPDTQPSKQQATQKDKTAKKGKGTRKPGYPKIQKSGQQDTQQPNTAEKSSEKLAKRENPDYTQTTFRIPKKLSRQINRSLMDLADEGIEMDRSDLLEELAGAFMRLTNDVGTVEALEKFKNLGTQMDE